MRPITKMVSKSHQPPHNPAVEAWDLADWRGLGFWFFGFEGLGLRDLGLRV